MPILILIRHGENDWVGKRLAGRTPGVHLNEKGQVQAQKIAEALSKAPIKAVYSSPLERAMETAVPLAQALSLDVQPHPGLMEIDFGRWQGKTSKQMHRMKLWKTVSEQPSQAVFPEGESFVGAQQRLVAAVDEILLHHEKEDLIALVSHSDAIKLLVAHYLSLPLDNFQRLGVDTASISLVALGEGHPYLVNMNYVLGASFSFQKPEKKPRKGRGKSSGDKNGSSNPVEKSDQ